MGIPQTSLDPVSTVASSRDDSVMGLLTTVLPQSEFLGNDGVKVSALLCARRASMSMSCAISAEVCTHVSPFREAQLLVIQAHLAVEKMRLNVKMCSFDSKFVVLSRRCKLRDVEGTQGLYM